jgi:exo-beta-1,3-glucanase (GH17 family)
VWHNPRARGGSGVTPLRAALLTPWLAALSLTLCGLALGANGAAAPRPACQSRPASFPALEQLRAALAEGRFVTYQPTSLKVTDGHVTPADPAGIRADLQVLRPRFDGLITYDAIHGVESVAAIAAQLEFRALIIGVWNPASDAELAAAAEAARRYPQLVLGLSLGNELLLSRRTNPAALAALIGRVRARLPATPLSTTEPFHIYYQPELAPLLGELDFLLVNVHPVFQPWFHDAPDGTAAQFVANVVAELRPRACGPILVKETGIPTAPESAGFTPQRQASFYAQLRRLLPPTPARAFAYFAAFDAPWRAFDALAVPGAAPGVHAEEAHWGLYDAERRPKQAAADLAPLAGY